MFKTTLEKVLIYTRKMLFILFHIPEVTCTVSKLCGLALRYVASTLI